MYLSLTVCDEELYQKAREFFIQLWRSDLLSREKSALIWAYLVKQYLRNTGKSWYMFEEWQYSYDGIFFSTSHSEDLVMVAVDTKKIAVDIESIRPRNESLLQNVHVPNSPYGQWENFYLQRCAKESLVKYLDLKAEDMDEMTVFDFCHNHYFSVNERVFDSLVFIMYKEKEYVVHTALKDGRVMALMHEHNFEHEE